MNAQNSGSIRFRISLFASLALHAVIAGLLFWKNTAQIPSEKPNVVEFEFREVPQLKIAKEQAGRTQPRAQPKKQLRDFIPKYDLTKTREIFLGEPTRPDESTTGELPTLRRSGPMGDPNYDAHGSEGAYGYMESMGLEQATETMPFYRALWGKIDQWMDFPKEIAHMRINGEVVVHLKVNREGQMVGDFLRIHADHPVLKTYALVILQHALRSPLHPRQHLPEGSKDVPVVLTFNFRVVTLTGILPRSGNIFKNGLGFQRSYYMHPYLYEQLDYVLTNYVPPIIPVPGGFYIDFIRAYQMIDNYANERPDMYEQRARRFDHLRDNLDLTLLKGEAEKARRDADAAAPTPQIQKSN